MNDDDDGPTYQPPGTMWPAQRFAAWQAVAGGFIALIVGTVATIVGTVEHKDPLWGVLVLIVGILLLVVSYLNRKSRKQRQL